MTKKINHLPSLEDRIIFQEAKLVTNLKYGFGK